MTEVKDEVLNIGATDNKVKYRLTFEDNTTKTVQIDLLTPVTQQGTPLNKALFDAISADLTARLLISSKATIEDVEAGTNNTKYVTSATLEHKLNATFESDTVSNTNSTTYPLVDFTNTDYKYFRISGLPTVYSSAQTSIVKLNGTSIKAFEEILSQTSGQSEVTYSTNLINDQTINKTMSSSITSSSANITPLFVYEIDLESKIINYRIVTHINNDRKVYTGSGTFTSLSNLQLILNGAGSQNPISANYTIEKWR